MSNIQKTKARVRRHLNAAEDAVSRAKDGVDCPNHVFENDEYVERQVLIAIEALNMAAARIRDYKASKVRVDQALQLPE